MLQIEQTDDQTLSAGVDEAGRGPLAGPVVAAAVILDPMQPIDGLADSKKLSAPRRARLAEQIRERTIAWSIASANVAEIDRLNILQATLLAMWRAVDGLSIAPEFVRVDGNRLPDLDFASGRINGETVIGGDAIVPAISAASILAKTARDQIMVDLDEQYPGYEFARHKGYGTALHCERLRQIGPCDIHRRTFAPVRNLLQ